ncbi:hypothetical protein J5N97_011658 [Dioscorea zingiberensis]|uniref:Uncharacterized protein n=1 Tax=Dioscorea zingiberensis TaxID=325984 RepID=A0A9D5HNU3_9LILI|nr:hypothetical protein J5N97_011658 [Dioscorea zingiberensis]
MESKRKEEPWKLVTGKKRQHSPPDGVARRTTLSRGEYPAATTAFKRTSSGVVESSYCPVPSSEIHISEAHEEDPAKRKGGKRKGKRSNPADESAGRGNVRMEEKQPRRRESPERKTSHKVSTALDDSTIDEVRRLKAYTIATVTKGYAGSVPSKRVKEEMAAIAGPDLNLSSEPFEDGRILLHCPSEEHARMLEKMGDLRLKNFTIRCEPCTAAANSTGKAEGERRWLNIKGMPIFVRTTDMIARMLKPIGDLVYLMKGGGHYVGCCRAAVRVRRGRRLPTTLEYDCSLYEFHGRELNRRGEPPLPWDLATEKEAGRRLG